MLVLRLLLIILSGGVCGVSFDGQQFHQQNVKTRDEIGSNSKGYETITTDNYETITTDYYADLSVQEFAVTDEVTRRRDTVRHPDPLSNVATLDRVHGSEKAAKRYRILSTTYRS
eukprot:m.288624 g.288624  ORF g.288624 m.288624 type:complete len:115 (+) comp201353_c0_seq1:1-345(+)